MFDWLFLYPASFFAALIGGWAIAPLAPLTSRRGHGCMVAFAGILAGVGALLIRPDHIATRSDLWGYLESIVLVGALGLGGVYMGAVIGAPGEEK